jgi:hypothetical protein
MRLGQSPARQPRFAGYAQILRRPAFVCLFSAQFVSLLGTSAFRIALAWYVADTLQRPRTLGLVLAAFTLPQLFAGLAGGVLADRYSRKRVVVLSDIVSAAVFICMWALALRDALGLGSLLVLALLAGTSTAVFTPAAGALLPQVAGNANLRQANSLRVAGGQGAFILGPAVAGLALTAAGPVVLFLLNALSFVVSAVVLAVARVPAAPTLLKRATPLRDVAEGVGLVAKTGWLRSGIVLGALANLLLLAPLAVLVPVLVEQRSLGPGTLGAFVSAQAAGIVLGAVLAPQVTLWRRSALAVPVAGLSVASVACLAFAFPMSVAGLVVVGSVVGAGMALFEVHWDSHVQTNAGEIYLARVLAADAWLSFALRSIGFIAASVVGAWVGVKGGIVGSALIFLASLSVLIVLRESRDRLTTDPRRT